MQSNTITSELPIRTRKHKQISQFRGQDKKDLRKYLKKRLISLMTKVSRKQLV